MKLASIFKLLEHANDFQAIGYAGHISFQNKAKFFFHRHVFIEINIPYKFGGNIFITQQDIYKGLCKNLINGQTD